MSAARTFRKVAAFFRRDLAIARSYRGAFLLEIFQALFGVATFYYLSVFVQNADLARALPQGGSYFAFALVGLVFFDYLTVALSSFEDSLRLAQADGTLESILVTDTPLPLVLLASAAYPFALLALRTLIYLAWGILLFDFPAREANWPGGFLVLLVSILSFVGLGIFSAAYVLLFKRGNPMRWAVVGLASLVGGMMYPVDVLPPVLQVAARLFPLTYSLQAMRVALLRDAPLAELWPALRALLLFAAVLLPASMVCFDWALRRTKATGTLTHS